MYNGQYVDHDFGIKCDGKHGCSKPTIAFDQWNNKFYCEEHAIEKIREGFRREGPEGWLEREDTGKTGVCDSCKKTSTKTLWYSEDEDNSICVDCCEEEYIDDGNDILDSLESWDMVEMSFMEQSELEAYAKERE